MKKILLIISWIVLLAFPTIAQHCPFDGSNMIAVYVSDKKGKPILDASKYLKLVEINNPNPDSCSYAKGILQKTFLPTKEHLLGKYQDHWAQRIEPYYKDWQLFNAGFYAVTLNQAEESCMIDTNGDFQYRKRQFAVIYQKNGRKQTIKVPKDKIYSLCTSSGEWTRIVAINIKTK